MGIPFVSGTELDARDERLRCEEHKRQLHSLAVARECWLRWRQQQLNNHHGRQEVEESVDDDDEEESLYPNDDDDVEKDTAEEEMRGYETVGFREVFGRPADSQVLSPVGGQLTTTVTTTTTTTVERRVVDHVPASSNGLDIGREAWWRRSLPVRGGEGRESVRTSAAAAATAAAADSQRRHAPIDDARRSEWQRHMAARRNGGR